MKYLRIAKKVASSSVHEFQLGAILISGGRILAAEHNRHGVHAEVRVLKKAGERAKGAILLVARVNRSGNLTMARPCKNCWKVIESSGVKNVWYTDWFGELENEDADRAAELQPRIRPTIRRGWERSWSRRG